MEATHASIGDASAVDSRRILLSAYACEPNRGGEPDIGWQWALAYRAVAEVWVLTRANNRSSIESWESENGATGIHWVWVDAPQWVLRIKKAFGRLGILTYYWLWQWLAAGRAAAVEQADGPFDWAHQLTMNGFREPGRLDRLHAPLVWGPIGGLQNSDWALSRLRGWRAALLELLRSVANDVTKFASWRAKRAVRNRALVIGANHESMTWIRRWRQSGPAFQMIEIGAPAAARGAAYDPSCRWNILWAGNDESRKNPEFALLAWKRLHERDARFRLTMIGLSDRRQSELRRWAGRRGIEFQNAVTLVRWVTLQQLAAHYLRAGQFWFTSYRDTSGTVVLWALAHGVPCIAFDHQGGAILLGNGRGVLVSGESVEDRLAKWCEAALAIVSDDSPRKIPDRPFSTPQIEWAPKPQVVAAAMRDHAKPSSRGGDNPPRQARP